jgi:hypothetical protein
MRYKTTDTVQISAELIQAGYIMLSYPFHKHPSFVVYLTTLSVSRRYSIKQ